MRVCLLNPPDLNTLDSRLEPPLGLMYISSYLKENNVDVKLIDLAFHEFGEWKEIIQDNPADLYGMTVYSASFNSAIELSKIIKHIYPNSKIIMGGSHPTALSWQTLFDTPADFVCINEGEETMLELCRNFGNEFFYPSITGLCYKLGNRIFLGNARPLIEDLDSLPFPDRETIPIKDYTRVVEDEQSCAVMASRGCPYNCAFCCSRKFWAGTRFQSIEKTLKELETIKEKYKFKAINFHDDTFTLNSTRCTRRHNKLCPNLHDKP